MWSKLRAFGVEVAQAFAAEEEVSQGANTPLASSEVILGTPRVTLPPPTWLSVGDDVSRPCCMDDAGQS
jgi:hypothetical protein